MRILILGKNSNLFAEELLKVGTTEILKHHFVKTDYCDSKIVMSDVLIRNLDPEENCIVSGLSEVYLNHLDKYAKTGAPYYYESCAYIEEKCKTFDVVLFLSDTNILNHTDRKNEMNRSVLLGKILKEGKHKKYISDKNVETFCDLVEHWKDDWNYGD